MGSGDEYDTIPDDALVAALEAAERSASSSSRTQLASRPQPPPQKPVQPTPQAAASKLVQPTPQKVSRATGSEIIVSTRQKGNPILQYIKAVPWSYGPPTLAADYILGASTCALFLSLKYHKLHPDYLHTRLRTLGDAFTLRILLVLVDITEHTTPLKQLTKICVSNNLTMLLSWSSPEAGRYLEAVKMYEHTQPTAIMEKLSEEYGERMVEVFTRVRGVNRTDAVTAVSTFGSVRRAANASEEERLMVAGWGPQKCGRFERAIREPFKVGKTKTGTVRKAATRKAPRPSDDVAAKLGLGMQRRQILDQWTVEDDEEALAAVAAMEAEEERARRRTTAVAEGAVRPTEKGDERETQPEVSEKMPPDMPAEVFEALAKLRQRTS
ncbi:mating-type switching protein swi10 [Sphaerosporella brunnea]|uniref:Mating-type switching protein swi10 n=1 Tax=Sphaerosporella brunnea TaxID=1250544 RepID=A0A5J5EEA9_9PEZI|nr:mating-type switching protein swi10 [Sphaerosporella brunnea]